MRFLAPRFLTGLVLAGLIGWTGTANGQDTKKPDAKPDTAKSESTKEEPGNLLKPTSKVESWRWEQAEGGKGKLSLEGDWVAFKVTDITGTDWHVQAVLADLELKDGQEYKLTFEIKSDVRRSVSVNAMIDQDDWHEIGLHEDLYLGTEPKKQEFTFRVSGAAKDKKNRITFALGTDKGTVFVKNVRLVEVKP